MPTANNKVDGSIKDKSQVLDGPLIENRIRGSLFIFAGLKPTVINFV
jgi:hypothetical protein